MSRPITVVKEKQTKPRSFFAFVYSYSKSLHVNSFVSVWQIIKQQRKVMGPASEAGGLKDYSNYFHQLKILLIPQ